MSSESPESGVNDITTALASAPPPPIAFEGENPQLQKECEAYQPTDTEKALQQYRGKRLLLLQSSAKVSADTRFFTPRRISSAAHGPNGPGTCGA